MSRFLFAVFTVAGLLLTAYFGVAAWRLSDELRSDVTRQIRPAASSLVSDASGQHLAYFDPDAF
jgi:hypothetical protein